MKILVLLLFYTALYAVNCHDFIHEFYKTFQDQNKVLLVQNPDETIINLTEFNNNVWYLSSGHKVLYVGCDSNNNTIIFENIEKSHSYIVSLTNKTILLVADYFGSQDFIDYQLKNPEKSKIDYIIEYENSFISATPQSLTAQSLAYNKESDLVSEFIEDEQLESVSNQQTENGEESSTATSLKRPRTDYSIEMDIKRPKTNSLIPNITEVQKEQLLPHNDLHIVQQEVSYLSNPISEEVSAVNNQMLHGTNETASGIDKVDTKTPTFVQNKIYNKTLPKDIIDFFNIRKFFSKDYGILYKIPSNGEESMNDSSVIDKLDSFLFKLKPNHNLVLVSKNWIKAGGRSGDDILYLVINKKSPLIYYTESYNGTSITYSSSNLKFNYNDRRRAHLHYIILKFINGKKSNSVDVSDFYVFDELGNYTDESLTGLHSTGNLDVYNSMNEVLEKLFMGDKYYIDENYKENNSPYLSELISKYKETNESFIFVNNRYLKNYTFDIKNLDTRVGLILEPINSYSKFSKRLFKVSDILIDLINKEYKFVIKELDKEISTGFEDNKLTYYSYTWNQRRRINITNFKLLRKKM